VSTLPGVGRSSRRFKPRRSVLRLMFAAKRGAAVFAGCLASSLLAGNHEWGRGGWRSRPAGGGSPGPVAALLHVACRRVPPEPRRKIQTNRRTRHSSPGSTTERTLGQRRKNGINRAGSDSASGPSRTGRAARTGPDRETPSGEWPCGQGCPLWRSEITQCAPGCRRAIR